MRPRYVNLIVELLKLSNPIDYGINTQEHIYTDQRAAGVGIAGS